MPDAVKNLLSSLVAAAPTPPTSGLTLGVTPGSGASFVYPADYEVWAGGQQTTAAVEYVRVTGPAVSDVLPIVRAQQGSVALPIAVGWQIALSPTAKVFSDLQAADAANAVALGALAGGLGSASTHAATDFDPAGAASTAQTAAIAAAVAAVTAQKGTASGLASLDGAGKLPASQLTVDAMEYKGSWNASTNSPALANGSGSPGDFYLTSSAGSAGPVASGVGDHVVLNPSLVWENIPIGSPATGFALTAVKTGAYTASANDYAPWDISGGLGTQTLPTAPPDKTRIGWKVIAVSGTPGSTSLTVTAGGSDTFNVTGGSTSLVYTAKFQSAIAQYDATSHVWVVQSGDTPLNVALGAAKLGTDGTVGGPSGSPLIGSVVRGSQQPLGNLGSTATLTLTTRDTQATATLTANCVLTVAGLTPGCQAALLFAQDATGGRTLAISDGATSRPVNIPTTASQTFEVLIYSPDGSTIYVEAPALGPQGGIGPTGSTGPTGLSWLAPTVVNASGSVTVPANAGHAKVTAVGGGGGGGGGGSNAAAANQSGGCGGGCGQEATAIVAVTPATTLTATVGAGGNGGAGGTAGGALGTAGFPGGTTTLTGSGVNITSLGGSRGSGGPANGTGVTAGGGGYGQAGTGLVVLATIATIGAGGIPTQWGGPAVGLSGGGGGGGAQSNTTNGGGAGTAATATQGGVAGATGSSGTAAGVTGAAPAANTGAGGNGGGGGTAGSAGGVGGAGGSGFLLIEWLP